MTREEARLYGEEYLNDLISAACDISEKHKEFVNMAIKALEQEPCDDAISRQAAIDVVHEYFEKYLKLNDDICLDGIRSLPSVTPKQKMGHWIEKDGYDGDTYYDCSECGESWSTIEGTPWDNGMKYCPNCGAKMVEPQESEE